MATVTLDVPDELCDLAAARGETLEALMCQVLADWLEEVRDDAEDARIALARWESLQRGEATARDWEEFEAELAAEGDAAGAVSRPHLPRGREAVT